MLILKWGLSCPIFYERSLKISEQKFFSVKYYAYICYIKLKTINHAKKTIQLRKA
jgi:hypothetical protein